MKKLLLAAAGVTIASPALAHHPLGGLPMETLAHGLLSGVGHPVLGFDHLFFVALMGVAAVFTGRKMLAPAAYIGAMLVGCAMIYAGVALPAVEGVVVASLVVLGGIVLSGRSLSFAPALVLFAAFGLFHGAAFGGSIAGQEGGVGGAVLLGYFVGLGLIQYAIALGAGWVAEKVLGATTASAINARLAGAMVAGVGVFMALEMVEGPIVAILAGA
ncbi:HupE/UreJ family protein [Flavimaricola marinus]|uniref:HupE / UreJ protein n=1 Tax=Flavimaricola marinus TaxID=1819565 RepID=A0A238LAA7_9RHOB|nr:HupE/UreJ family protein [Flavimaricola marinus]SMY06512.1 HupE / UreJ protein [Flavimaricola marinus]